LGSKHQNRQFGFKALGITSMLVVAIVLSGCKTKSMGLDADPMATASTNQGPSFKRTEALGKQWKADPTNVATTLAYAGSLEQLGQKQAQVEVLRAAAAQTRGDAMSQNKLGKAQLAAGDPVGASETLQRGLELNPQDAQLHSILGATLDQQTKHGEAREHHQAALALAPNDMSIMNNLGMSYALQGKLTEAEGILRKAMAHPNSKATPRVRQNLALVVGLQGRFDEAKQIASEDLPPDQVQANMAYLQQMLAQQNTWAKLKEG
jgi:Flp pilus assembly protein TadD